MNKIIEKIHNNILSRFGYTERYGLQPGLYLLKRIRHYLLSRYGSTATRQKIWDEEFSTGKWDHLVNTESDSVYPLIDKYLGNGTILDLGCGYGTTLFHNPGKFSRYTGVDISKFAIDRCKAGEKEAGSEVSEFFVSDIELFTPEGVYDIILFRESLYYLPKGKVAPVLRRYSAYLSENGVFIVRIFDPARFGYIIDLANKFHDVKETRQTGKSAILVFK